MVSGEHRRSGRRRRSSPLTRRILAVNVLALAILVAGLLYLGEYRRSLVAAELAALRTQAETFAAALGEGVALTEAATGRESTGRKLEPRLARQMVRRLAATTGTRARLFADDGVLVADSRRLMGPGGAVEVEPLPPPPAGGRTNAWLGDLLAIYDRVAELLPGLGTPPPYRENAEQKAADYEEVVLALSGDAAERVRGAASGMVLTVAVPVQRYKEVLAALMLSKGSRHIDEAVFDVRLAILQVFAVALAVTVLLSLYLAGTIARPIRRLAAAAERVRRGHNRHATIPDLAGRGDEIGELAVSLKAMTEALWQRMDAIERFAADVAHEIKNPLTSLRSAVETASRVEDPEQQKQLMTIVQEDVQRLDRLISDISDASRLDAELSRAETGPIALGPMLATLVEVHGTAAEDRRLHLEGPGGNDLTVNGMEGRLVQVFRNLIANAVSFSPPGGLVTVRTGTENGWVRVEVDDDGPGIPPGKEDAIFERFYSERPQGEKFGTHSGLGLSISKQIVEAHGGTVAAENRPEGGARFTVRLPAA